MEKFTITDRFEYGKGTPVKVGDTLKIISMKEFQELDVKFSDEQLQKQLADSYVKVVKIIKDDTDFYIYEVENMQGEKVPMQFYDSDIKYVLRGN